MFRSVRWTQRNLLPRWKLVLCWCAMSDREVLCRRRKRSKCLRGWVLWDYGWQFLELYVLRRLRVRHRDVLSRGKHDRRRERLPGGIFLSRRRRGAAELYQRTWQLLPIGLRSSNWRRMSDQL